MVILIVIIIVIFTNDVIVTVIFNTDVIVTVIFLSIATFLWTLKYLLKKISEESSLTVIFSVVVFGIDFFWLVVHVVFVYLFCEFFVFFFVFCQYVEF